MHEGGKGEQLAVLSVTHVVFLEACVWKLRLGAVLAAVRLFHRARQHERQRDEDAA